ncbi:ribbon-helix-helix protein, CopG family [Caballeronia sordidicola]|jgi:hypothetical protein|uniref:Ribbon-helix-helix CopG family protein n=1 Tax=Caballeronia sordidicola TaxID=196367 RepID=A0A226X4I1_CABSO|nr:ribbon-helix-helix protein, CopG family [Caballeronia sordidicola]OXC78253.1 hypothetical protein BSU04_12790 [Caballeronia sordidicola]
MALAKRPTFPKPSTAPSRAADAFIEGAHDTVGRAPKQTRDKKQKISVELYPDLLEAVDALAHQLHMSRAAVISLACSDLVESKLRK